MRHRDSIAALQCHAQHQRSRQVLIEKELHADSCHLPATDFQLLPRTTRRRAHAAEDGCERQIEVAEGWIVLANLRLADPLSKQTSDVIQRYAGSSKDGLSTKGFRMGDKSVEPLAVLIHILPAWDEGGVIERFLNSRQSPVLRVEESPSSFVGALCFDISWRKSVCRRISFPVCCLPLSPYRSG